MTNEDFPCTKCGACCKLVSRSELTSFLDRGDGICKFLDLSNNNCLIYDNRPEICNIRLQYEKNFRSQYSWDDFSKINASACIELEKIYKNETMH